MRDIARAFARVLVDHHKKVSRQRDFATPLSPTDIKFVTISYGELCLRAERGTPIGAGGFLHDVHRRCESLGLPPLNSLVVNKKTCEPGGNYPDGLKGWPKHLAACIKCKTYPNTL